MLRVIFIVQTMIPTSIAILVLTIVLFRFSTLSVFYARVEMLAFIVFCVIIVYRVKLLCILFIRGNT